MRDLISRFNLPRSPVDREMSIPNDRSIPDDRSFSDSSLIFLNYVQDDLSYIEEEKRKEITHPDKGLSKRGLRFEAITREEASYVLRACTYPTDDPGQANCGCDESESRNGEIGTSFRRFDKVQVGLGGTEWRSTRDANRRADEHHGSTKSRIPHRRHRKDAV